MTLVELAGLTSRQAGELGRGCVGLVHLGSFEQHGPHLPLITDSVLGEALAHRVANRLDADVVVTPRIPFGISDHHLGFPGTVTVSADTLRAVVSAFLEGLASLGIERLAVFSAHGGNFGLLAELERAGGPPGTELVCYSDFEAFVGAMTAAGAAGRLSPAVTDVHAGVLETSAMLAVAPASVGSFESVVGYVAAEDGWLDRLRTEGTHSLHETGVLGDPRAATPEAGALVLDALVELLACWIAERFEVALTRVQPTT